MLLKRNLEGCCVHVKSILGCDLLIRYRNIVIFEEVAWSKISSFKSIQKELDQIGHRPENFNMQAVLKIK